LGLRLLRGGARKPPARHAAETVRAQLRPEPLVAAGLATAGLATAAVDVSDGVLRDLGHVCEASRCGAEVGIDALPIGRAVRAARIDRALSGGEAYALVFAVRPPDARRLLSRLRRAGSRATQVGRFVRGRGIRLLQEGKPRPLPAQLGWDHLA